MLRGLSLMSRLFDEEFDTLFQELQSSKTKNKDQKTIYYKNGMVHNENGPAIVHKDGKEEYWLEGRKVTKEDVTTYRQNLEDNTKHCVYVADKPYIINGKQLRQLKSTLDDMTKVT